MQASSWRRCRAGVAGLSPAEVAVRAQPAGRQSDPRRAAGAIVYTWLYNSTSGSILAALLFHGSFNFVTASQAGTGLVAAVASSLVMAWAVVILIRRKSVRRPIGAAHGVKSN